MTNEEINNLTDEIVNKGLAEFMGYTVETNNGVLYMLDSTGVIFIDTAHYTDSLDSQIPVWEKIHNIDTSWGFQLEKFAGCGGFGFSQWTRKGQLVDQVLTELELTPQQASAYATYLAVMELKSEAVK